MTLVKEGFQKLEIAAEDRVKIATEHLRATVVKNISIAVGKGVSTRTGRIVVTERSVHGEYPRAETTELLKSIFGEVREVEPGVFEGYVGTPLEYGLILEVSPSLDRRFLLRTFYEEYTILVGILTGPIPS